MKCYCHKCNETVENPKIPRCLKCGNIYEYDIKYNGREFLKNINKPISHFKYHDFMLINYYNYPRIITMGEGNTPLIQQLKLRTNTKIDNLYFKCEYTNPTGSFKDRGSALEVTLAQGKDEIVVASTGNMGSSIAAYAAFAGIPCKIFIPKGISKNKIEQMEMYGAEVIEVIGDYTNAMEEAEDYYLGYENNFTHSVYLAGDYLIRVEGTKSIGFEICEQLDWSVPDYIIVPIGNGTLLWSIRRAMKDLLHIGIIDRTPRIIGVASDSPETTNISAIACPKPNAEFAVNNSTFKVVKVTDSETFEARSILAKNGFFVEPGGAVAYAGFSKLENIEGTVVILLTGHGLKGI